MAVGVDDPQDRYVEACHDTDAGDTGAHAYEDDEREHWSAQYIYAACAGAIGALSVMLAASTGGKKTLDVDQCASPVVFGPSEARGSPFC